nr:hypothetical protein [Tanacetum cinerariifolium]
MDGAVHTYKARLIAKGFTQTYGVDYEQTLSPVADIRAIRILIAIAAFYDYKIWQMDVKTAFLNGHLSEEVYMVQPEGFLNPKYPNRVCKFKRSIYGLKQASRQWNKRFDDEIKKFDFSQNRDEPCVYMKASESYVTFFILCFAMKDLGEAAYILGIKIYRDRSSIPMQEKLKLSKSEGASTPAELKRMKNVPYASDVGFIMYDVRCTRLDVANTKDMFLVYGGDLKRELECQAKHFSTSSAEAEYIATFDASKEAVWVRKFISGLGVVPTVKEPISMYYDNTVAIAIANESGITKGARHFRVKVHYLREIIEYGDIKLEKVHRDDNLADPFTKAFAFLKHSKHTRNIGMLPASSLL